MSKIWVKKRVNCQKPSSGPTCRYYIAILISSLRDIFLPKIWAKKCPNFGGKNVQGVKKHYPVLHVDTTLLFWNHHLGTLFSPKFGGKNVQNLGKKRVNSQKTSSGPTCRYYITILISSLRDTFFPKIWGKKCPQFGEKNV